MPKETFTRPKDWYKKTKRSYWDEDKDYTGKKFEDYDEAIKERKKEEVRKKAQKKGKFQKLIDYLNK